MQQKLTPRENWLKYLNNEEPERIPTSMDQKPFRPDIIIENIARGMINQQHPIPEEKYGGKDLFGGDWIYEPEARGSIEIGCLLDDPDDLENWEELIHFPDLDAIDWEGCAKENAEYLDTDKLITSTLFTGFFERLISFIGFENAAMALIDEDCHEAVHGVFDRLADLYIDLAGRLHRYFNVEYVDLHDDWGTQRSPMMSVQAHKEMIIPYIRKTVEGCHKNGVYVEQHSCGMIEPLIPALISSGIDTWRGQPLNDKEKLVNEYGDRFKFGVQFGPGGANGPESDEDLIRRLRQTWDLYKGKRVWIGFGAGLSGRQKELLHQEFLKLQGAA